MKTNSGTYHDVGIVPEAVGDTGNAWRELVAAIPEVEMLGSREELLQRLTGRPARAGDSGRDEALRMICEDAEVTDAWKALACVVAGLDSPDDPDILRLRARDRGWLRSLELMDGEDEADDYSLLKRALRIGKATGRILSGDGRIGTGLLVGPGLLLTNNHLIGDLAEAESAVVTFDYELQHNGLPSIPAHFRITGDVFMTSPEVDYCFVSVAPISIRGLSAELRYLSEFGFSPLAPETGKTARKQFVNLLQHPDGGPKSIASKGNVVLGYQGDHVYYVAGTQRISSGALICNPQWLCVALHQMAIPDPRHPSKTLASRGVRISSILKALANRRQGGDPDAISIERLLANGRRPFALENERRKFAAALGFEAARDDFRDAAGIDDPDDWMHFDMYAEDDRYYGPEPESEDEYYQYEWGDDNDRCDDTDAPCVNGVKRDDGIRLACINGRSLDNNS